MRSGLPAYDLRRGAASTAESPSLGTLLRGWRTRSDLTQEQLAERAGLNVRTIRRLELDAQHRPRRASVHLLAKALSLDIGEKALLIAAAGGDSACAMGGGFGAGGSPPLGMGVPRQLPPNAAHFVGRRKELFALDDMLAAGGPPDTRVLVIVGSAGIGKTTLAVQWCSQVADGFPDGQLYVNLLGFATLGPVEPLTALTTLLRSLGVTSEELPGDLAAASALFRTRTAGRRMLILLDNALSSEQVRPLLPSPGCVVVVTSRDQLRSLFTRDATARICLSPLELTDSVALLSRVSGRATIRCEDYAVRELTNLCDNSPLAIRIIGERLSRQPGIPLSDIIEGVACGHERLDAFHGGDDAYSDLRTVLSWSYQNLDPDTAWVLRTVGGLYPGGEFCTAAASALTGFSHRQTRRHLDRLVSTHLVGQHGRDRYRLHGLVHAYAMEESVRHDAPSVRRQAVSRLVTWFIHTLYAADAVFTPGRLREPMVELGELSDSIEPITFADPSAAEVGNACSELLRVEDADRYQPGTAGDAGSR